MPLQPHVFRKTVTTGGTRERLTTSDIKVLSVTIQAIQDNTNDIYVGGGQVGSSRGIELDALDSITFDAKGLGMGMEHISLKDIWIDADTNGEGVDVIILEAIN